MKKAAGFLGLALALALGGCFQQGASSAPEGVSSALEAASSSASVSDTGAGSVDASSPEVALHFSVDDVISVFVDLHFNQDEYDSIFDQPTLAFLRDMHQRYGMVTTLYCFYESYDGGFDLSQCTSRYAAEFAENADWLRVGFHARAPGTFFSELTVAQAALDYRDMMRQLTRICGAGSIDSVVRLHWWDADEEQIEAMAGEGLQGLLAGRRLTDGNYHLAEQDQPALFERDFLPGPAGVFYTPTDLWLEDEDNLNASLAALLARDAPGLASGLIVVFTHEYAMGDPNMHAEIERCAQFALDNGFGFAFPLDFYMEKELI